MGRLRQFLSDASGNAAMLFALSVLPITVLAGIGIDYFGALSLQSRIAAASDAAALAAVNTAELYVKNNSLTESGQQLINDAIAAGKAQGLKAFNANLGVAADEVTQSATPTLTLIQQTSTGTGQATNSFQSTVDYVSSFKTSFGPLIGVNSFPVHVDSAANAQYPAYMDVYFLIDASGSMGIGATDGDQSSMQSAVGCTVACHSPWNGWNKFWPNGTYPNVRAIQPAVTLRIDVVKQAVINELKIMQASTFSGQLRVAIYEFSNDLTTLYPLSTDIAGAITAAANIDVIGAANEGGTYATYSLNQFSKLLPRPGDGSSNSSRLGSVLLFTDGIQNDSAPQADGSEVDSCQFTANFTPYAPTSQCEWKIQGFNSADCGPIKSLGYTMYTLDFIYYVTAATMATDSRYAFIGGTLNPSVQSNMQACATSASNAVYAMTPQDFDTALSTLVSQVLANVRLTQ